MQHYAFMLRASLSSLTDYMTPCHVGRKLGKEQHGGILKLRRRGLKAGGGILFRLLVVVFLLGWPAKLLKSKRISQANVSHMYYWNTSCSWPFFQKWTIGNNFEIKKTIILTTWVPSGIQSLHFFKNYFTRQSQHEHELIEKKLVWLNWKKRRPGKIQMAWETPPVA